MPHPSGGSKWKLTSTQEFKGDFERLTRKNPILLHALETRIAFIASSPLRAGKRSKYPSDSRHIHVLSDWVIFWRVHGDVVQLLRCGRHDEFFRI
jgi:mRNA-degrading endonuclease YafQ of YafQ-DinJ toxin-antitoxin module